MTGSRCGVRAGAYYTDASGFFPGLVLTIPDGWSVTEHFPGELSLGPKDRPDDRLLLWKDMRVVVSNHKTDPAGTIVSNVASSPEALVKWFTTNEDFVVLDDPVPVAVAGAKGQALTVGVSVDADYADPGCPSNPRCADFVTDPRHWGGDFYGVGGETTIRMSILTVPYAADPHQFMVVLEVPSADDLAAFAAEAEPVVDSIVLPATYQAN